MTPFVISPRDVPLGGIRSMTVRRTLPDRARTRVGAWCFLDHYGPDDVSVTGGMHVAPHPHTSLQTVTWLFSGDVEHRDSAGFQVTVRPGELNLMTAGRGISHSEHSTANTDILHGVQLWVALPEHARGVAPTLAHHRPPVVSGTGWRAQVFLGSMLGDTSPVATYTPLLGAEINLDAGASLTLDVDPAWEVAVLVDRGAITAQRGDNEPTVVPEAHLWVSDGGPSVDLQAGEEVRVVVLGGAPYDEPFVMWWNFLGAAHEDIVAAREAWEQLLTDGAPGRFSLPARDSDPALHAPTLPGVRLKARQPNPR